MAENHQGKYPNMEKFIEGFIGTCRNIPWMRGQMENGNLPISREKLLLKYGIAKSADGYYTNSQILELRKKLYKEYGEPRY